MDGLRRAALTGEQDYGPEARHFVERNFYVDDGLTSLPTEEEGIKLLRKCWLNLIYIFTRLLPIDWKS